ncbi:hypothetical protein D9615_004905 [Tricholomella constricta]|uniref:Intradiol ring-cleavage dioxygenases domain-containing protein n=1 Tax=Tricholomella constricta TaxID=117010 RepID=A0A8H5M6P6_9AGAR|nr:hypothetical protein D9615_004905 [Tricholomella constricta]
MSTQPPSEAALKANQLAAQHGIDLSKLPKIVDMSADSITDNVHAINSNCTDERTKFIFKSLIDHLHAFVRETSITSSLQVGNPIPDTNRENVRSLKPEFILLSDALGVSTLVDTINNAKPPGATEATVLGPFYTEDAHDVLIGDSIASEGKGDYMFVEGRVLDTEGNPIAGAIIDTWETDSNGLYDTQYSNREKPDCRGRLTSAKDGSYSFRAVVPVPYPIPSDGTVGNLLSRLGRHVFRPAHLHMMIEAPGFEKLTTALYFEGDPYLTSDAVFGVRTSLIVNPELVTDVAKTKARGFAEGKPHVYLKQDFILATPEEGAAARKAVAQPIHLQDMPEWNWEIEHADRRREARADAALHGATPFQVDRRVLKDVVRENKGIDVGRIEFLSAGTFHKAYLITLSDHFQLVAGVARRYMPRLKTESEVATMHYLRENTTIPVPTVYHYDSNPYNRLGGEYILMSKAPGVSLATIFHSLCYNDLVKLLENLAAMILPLFAHRFTDIGSLYFGPDPYGPLSSSAPTPRAVQHPYSAFPFSPTLSMSHLVTANLNTAKPLSRKFHVGPIISWPFFGTNRGELTHPTELNRGPWPSSSAYFASCAQREIDSVIRENEGKSAPHRLHLDPDQIQSSRHHRMKAVPGDESDESDEWDLAESEEEWEGPGDAMYRDYRRMQRTTFLVAHLSEREVQVRSEMARWMNMMDRLVKATLDDAPETFGLDCHDLSLENIFVDPEDPSKITCIIDWESTTTRPLWQCAHLPAFVQTSPFIGRLFREAIIKVGKAAESSASTPTRRGKDIDIGALAREWLFYESAGQRLRMAHRFVEWDGWEEGLIDNILGPEENEDDWFKDIEGMVMRTGLNSPPAPGNPPNVLGSSVSRKTKLPFAKEKEKEQMLNTTGDYCGGRGGELGRRLEAWLTINGIDEGHSIAQSWERDHELLKHQQVLVE